jgi:hypothetical protein
MTTKRGEWEPPDEVMTNACARFVSYKGPRNF